MKTLEQWWDAKRDDMKNCYLRTDRLSAEERRTLVYLHDWGIQKGWGEPQTTLQAHPELYDTFRAASLAMCKQLEAMTEAYSKALSRG